MKEIEQLKAMVAALTSNPNEEQLSDIVFFIDRVKKVVVANRMNAKESSKDDKRVIKG